MTIATFRLKTSNIFNKKRFMSRVAQKCTKNGREKCTTLASWSIHIDNFLFDFFFSHGDPSGKPKTFPPNIQNNTVMEQPAG